MRVFLRISVLFFFLAMVAVSCQEKEMVEGPDAVNTKGMLAVIDLGLPGGTDPVDGAGNVTVSRNVHLTSGNTYILHNYFRIQNGYTITIDAGVTIHGEKEGTTTNDIVTGTLVIERGAQIIAEGSCDSPIVFTSNQSSPAPGDWGGVVILGKADVNLAGGRGEQPSGIDGLGFIEGLPTPNNTGRYGNGDNPPVPSGGYNADNSGIMQYVRIEYAGHEIGEANELNGLTMGGVGSGTTLDHIMVSYGYDDGFEFFGGNVNATYLIASQNRDDDFDTDQGYAGKIQFGISRKTPSQLVASTPVGGFESNGDLQDAISGVPFTNGTFSNFTIIGPIYPNSTSVQANFNSGALIRDESELNIFNSIIVGYPNYQLQLATVGDFDSDGNDGSDNVVSIEGVTLVRPTFSGFTAQGTNVSNFTSIAAYNNQNLTATTSGTGGGATLPTLTGLSAAAWNISSPSFVAVTERSSDFSNDLLDDDAEFTWIDVDFRGAFGNSGDTNNPNWCINGAWVAW